MAKDKHDPRDFEQYVKLHVDGTVASTHLVAVGSAPRDEAKSIFLNVSHLTGTDLTALTVDPALVSALRNAKDGLEAAALSHAQAFADHATAERTTMDAIAASVKRDA
jgi:hypothetical protein